MIVFLIYIGLIFSSLHIIYGVIDYAKKHTKGSQGTTFPQPKQPKIQNGFRCAFCPCGNGNSNGADSAGAGPEHRISSKGAQIWMK